MIHVDIACHSVSHVDERKWRDLNSEIYPIYLLIFYSFYLSPMDSLLKAITERIKSVIFIIHYS